MDAPQAPRRFQFRYRVVAVTLTVAGCALIYLGAQPQQLTGKSSPSVSTIRQSRMASSRGSRLMGSSPTAAIEPTVAAPVVDSSPVSPSSLGTGGLAVSPLTVEDTPGVGGPAAAPTVPTAEEALGTGGLEGTPTPTATAQASVTPTAIAPTATPPRTGVIVYKVQAGDNLYLISRRFNISQDTIVWANPGLERDPDQLSIGQELNILPVDGVLHTVERGDTLNGIAQRYKVDPQRIIGYAPNGISDAEVLRIGQKLIIPGGVKPPEPRPTPMPARGSAVSARGQTAPATISGGRLMIPAGAPAVPVQAPAQPGRFIWPARGVITQGYGKWHGAIDIANKQGTPILAADGGTVTFAGVSGGLGNAIQIDHGDGFATTYGHLRSIRVQVGQGVEKGQQIGEMGSTGASTGPHLHLIFTYRGGIINPLDYLPQ